MTLRTLRGLALALALAASASAQIVIQDHATGVPLSSPLLLPATAVNDFTAQAIDVVNTGSESVTIDSAVVTGLDYSLCCESGFVLAAGAKQTLTLKFAPTYAGYFTGALQVDATEPIFIYGQALAADSLFLQTATGVTQAFIGSPTEVTVALGQPLPATLQNNTTGPVIVNAISATGDFTLQNLPALPLTLQAGAQASFTLVPAPSASTPNGSLQIDQWTYTIGAHPPSANIHIMAANPLVQSGQQSSLSIEFDKPPTTVVTGTVSISLMASGSGVALTDPGVLFPSTGSTTASFTSVPGSTAARFDGQNSITFQTGTTDGTIHVAATWGFSQDAFDINIQPAPIGIDTVTAKRGSTSLTITVTGFDNTRTAGLMSFSFFDKQGAFIRNPVEADFTEAFQTYFQQTSNAGGMFQMVLQFPVTGGTSDVASVKLDLNNQAGDAQSSVTSFH